jgi:MFS family permease
MFTALRHRNFKIYLSGQLVSLIGTWMQQLATSWLVYRLTNSPFWLGVSMFASMAPSFFLGLFAGVAVDRINRHKLLLWTQSLLAAQALILAGLSFTHTAKLEFLILLNVVAGVINAFDMPGRQAFVAQMVTDRRDLPNAIALNSMVMNGTRLIGPAIAGATIAVAGESICFLLNAISYLAVLLALRLMKFEKIPPAPPHTHWAKSLKAGYHAAFGNPSIRRILFLLGFNSLIGMHYNTLFPALAAQTLKGGAGALGAITAAAGCGSLVGALFLARRESAQGMEKLLGRSGVVFGLALLATSRTQSLTTMLPCLFVAGLGVMILLAGSNTVIQTLTEDDKRGRTMSFFTFSIMGVAPFGSLLIGWLAQKMGIPGALALSGTLSVAGAATYLRQTHRRVG